MTHRFSTSIFNEIGGNHLTLSEADIKNIGLLTSFIQSEILSQETSFKEQVYHYFLNVLILIERLRNKQGVTANTSRDYQLASQFKRMIFEQIDQFHPIDSFASQLGTNSKHLTEVSKEFLGNTPANLIKESKLLEAKRMMANQKVSIKEIAYSLGFEDPTYFTKYFKKGTGMTPKEFKKLHF
jgi:AraC-like DNA-binding protein